MLTYAYWRGAIAEEVGDALCERARAGVECNVIIDAMGGVQVLVPGEHIDKPPVRVAGRASYDELVAQGVEVYEYTPTMLHAKTLVLDGVWSPVGSVNFDNRSFQLHDEATLCVQSREFAAQLTEQFERDLEVAEWIDAERWRQRGARQRASEAMLRLARREL